MPDVVRAALAGPAADDPGYPTTHGPESLREAIAGSLARRFGVTVDPVAVLPDDRVQGAGRLAAHAARARRRATPW